MKLFFLFDATLIVSDLSRPLVISSFDKSLQLQ